MKAPGRYLSCIVLVVMWLNTAAQSPFSKKIDIEDENLTLKANVLFKDHNGFLWIGTSEGLFKYNAVVPEKIILPTQEKVNITALFEDEAGTIWAGCKTGQVITVKNQTISYFKCNQKLPTTSITAIYSDAQKRLWLATAGEGLYCCDSGTLYNITTADGLGDDNVNCLYSADGKKIIAGTDRGLSFINFEKEKKNIHFFVQKMDYPIILYAR